jgi:hypothetical protein
VQDDVHDALLDGLLEGDLAVLEQLKVDWRVGGFLSEMAQSTINAVLRSFVRSFLSISKFDTYHRCAAVQAEDRKVERMVLNAVGRHFST